MKKTALLLLIALSYQPLFAQTVYSGQVAEQIRQVENHLAGPIKVEGQKDFTLQQRMAHYKVKGLSIAVIQNYKVIWAKGYGWADEAEKRPVTTETLFEPGSISKSLNAMAVLKLVQDKKLDLYTDINTYLRSWTFPYDSVSKNKKITLANLLSHTAGLTVHGFPGYNRKAAIPTVPQILDGKAPANTPAVRSMFEPGLKFKYSGGGTTISQLIVSDVTQTPYDQFLAQNVFTPLGMTHTTFTQPLPNNKTNMAATGYHSDGNEVGNKFHVYPEQGAAGLWTTPTDLCQYIIETQLSYEGKSSKVLSPEMTKLRLSPYIDNSAALGVFIEEIGGIKYFQHGAGNEGFRGMYWGSLEGGNGVAVFVNSDNGQILSEIINSVATVYNWKGFYNPILKKEVKGSDQILQQSTGLYIYDNRFSDIVKQKDGYYIITDGDASRIHFSDNKSFFNLESPVEKQFTTDASGRITGFSRKFEGNALPAAIKVVNADTMQGDAELFNAIGWHYLEQKNYDAAIQYLKRGLALHPNSLLIAGNLAHGYLFRNDYQTALNIYKSHLNETIADGFTWNAMIVQDFQFFKERNFNMRLMNNMLTDLKLQWPEGE